MPTEVQKTQFMLRFKLKAINEHFYKENAARNTRIKGTL